MTDYELLREWATPAQLEKIDALKKHGSGRKAAKAIGVHERNFWRSLQKLREKAARQGFSPEHDMTRPAPDGFHVKGTSTLYDADGNQKGQWVKTRIDHERQQQIMQEAVEALSETIKPAKPVKAPKHTVEHLLNQYTITDYHFGMLAWDEETGADWDLDIAERTILDWFQSAIRSAPDAAVGVFAQIGDFLHWDGLEALTPTSRHVLDADTRFQKVIRVVIRCVRQIVTMLLKKHQHVHIIMAEGNHDIASSVWMREWLAVLYADEPRVTVDNSADIYYCYEFGNTCLFYHHGHKKKLAQTDSVFVGKFREQYGRTKHHYAHMGHLHHDVVRETNLMKVEQHRTLAAPDAHASRGGWMSGRDAKVITYHKEFGKVGELTISPAMLASKETEAKAGAAK